MPHYFRDRDIRKIEWGKNTYDLFTYSSDTGLGYYAYEDGNWYFVFIVSGLDREDASKVVYYKQYQGTVYDKIDESTMPEWFKSRFHNDVKYFPNGNADLKFSDNYGKSFVENYGKYSPDEFRIDDFVYRYYIKQTIKKKDNSLN